MSRAKWMDFEKLRARARGVSCFGTLCGVLAMLVFVTGCPPQPPAPCTDDAGCADTLFCNGAETCNVDTGECVPGTAPCTEEETCNEEEDRCDACIEDADCADEDYCNGDEMCVDGQCAEGTSPCLEDEVCDEETDACVGCLEDADCDDEDPCTENVCSLEDFTCSFPDVVCEEGEECVDGACLIICTEDVVCVDADLCTEGACVEGYCAFTDIVCDDMDLCTDDTCDPATGCVFTDAVCPEGETCDPATGGCVAAITCVDDAGCDDGVFCNGAETCVDTVCVAGTEPCDDGFFCNGTETCDEDNNVCLDGADPCDPVTETCDDVADVCSPIETFVLTEDVDLLNGTEFDDVFRGTDETADTGDLINGRGGIDRFDWITSAAENDLIDAVGLELIYVRNTWNGGQEINLSGFDGFTQLWFDRGTEDLLLDNVPAIAAVGYTGGTGDGDFEVVFDDNLVDGTEDALDIFLDGADGDDIIADGFEIFNVNITGDNDLDDLASNDLETVNFLGGSSLVVDNVIDDADTFDASGSTADIDITVDDVDVTYTGGSGADVVRFGEGEFDDEDLVDGGTGDSDEIHVGLDDNVISSVTITNTELLGIAGDDDGVAETFTFDVGGVTGLDTVRLESLGPGSTGDTVFFDDMAFGPAFVFRGTGDNENQVFDGVQTDYTGAPADATLDVTINNRSDEDLDEDSRTIAIGLLDIDDVVNLNLTLEDGGDLTITDINGVDLESLTIVANSSVTVTNALESDAVATVDASATDGGASVDASNSTVELTMTGGGGGDTLVGGDDVDELDGGEGDDTLRGGPSPDELIGGGDADTFQWNDGDEGAADDVNAGDTVDDFSLTGDDDIISVEDAGALDVVGAATLAFALEAGAAAGDNVIVFNATEAAATTTAAIEDVIQAVGTAGEAIIGVVLTPSDNVFVVYDDDSGVDGGGASIIVLAVIDEIDGDDPTDATDLDDFVAANFEIR